MRKDFTLKYVKYEFRKISMEFTEQIDPDLRFYYHTSVHTRFNEGSLQNFNELKEKKNKIRVPRGEQPVAAAFGRRALEIHFLSNRSFVTFH